MTDTPAIGEWVRDGSGNLGEVVAHAILPIIRIGPDKHKMLMPGNFTRAAPRDRFTLITEEKIVDA